MIRVSIDASALVRFVQNLQRVPAAIERAAARALNSIGEQVLDSVMDAVSAQTGMDAELLRNYIMVQRATPDNTEFSIDASQALIEAPETRPMPLAGRRRFAQRPSGYFHAEELVQIVTMGDELVCQICQDLEADGPYQIEEARQLIPAHPHCRCLVQSHRSRRELPVAFRKGQNVEVASVTMQQLSTRMRDEVRITLKALIDGT